jgi:hypothetical protein
LVLRPLVATLRRAFGCPVFLGGDFNATKLQAASAENKTRDAPWLWEQTGGPGVYAALCGHFEENRSALENDSDNENDTDDGDAFTCADTYEIARAIKKARAKPLHCVYLS